MKVDWQKKGTPMSRVIFWYVKSSRDDPFAEVALDVVANKKFRGISANLFSTNNEQTGINLMVDYVDWVDADYATLIEDLTYQNITLDIGVPFFCQSTFILRNRNTLFLTGKDNTYTSRKAFWC
jgi:hypothetical protein